MSLAVAVILYDAGLALNLTRLRGHTRRVVRRLILDGVPVTWAFGAVFAVLLLGMSRQAAVMIGAILGAVVFHAVLASTHRGLGYQLGWFLVSISIGVAGAVAGVAVL